MIKWNPRFKSKICRDCKQSRLPDHIFCQRCAEKAAKRAKARQAHFRKLKKCYRCGQAIEKTSACKACKDKYRRYHRRLKEQAILAYGGKCNCCEENELFFLTIDHINDNGAQHRREVGRTIYQWLKNNKYPPGFQVLCFNCNHGKFLTGGVCPHKLNLRNE